MPARLAMPHWRKPATCGSGRDHAVNSMLRHLFDTIADLWRSRDSKALNDVVMVEPEDDVDPFDPERRFRAQFIELARHRQRSNGQLLAGQLTLNWQGSRVTMFGARQAEMKRLTSMVSEVVLEQMADLPDLVLQHDADRFLVCFAGTGEPIAELRLAMMAQALQAALEQRIPEISGKLRIDAAMTSFNPALPLRRSRNLAKGLASLLHAARHVRAFGPLGAAPQLRRGN